jgi:hypothetical protein
VRGDGPRCFIIPGNHGLSYFYSFRQQKETGSWKPFLFCFRLDCHALLCNTIFFIGATDWFDGLRTFMRNICHKNWLRRWFLPQKKSYFALQLPKGWWIFGLDLALEVDIDRDQFQFFSKLARETVFNFLIFLL